MWKEEPSPREFERPGGTKSAKTAVSTYPMDSSNASLCSSDPSLSITISSGLVTAMPKIIPPIYAFCMNTASAGLKESDVLMTDCSEAIT
jgi:hypothetical protein